MIFTTFVQVENRKLAPTATFVRFNGGNKKAPARVLFCYSVSLQSLLRAKRRREMRIESIAMVSLAMPVKSLNGM